MNILKTFVFDHKSSKFIANLYRDPDMGPPWKAHDGHGVVRSGARKESHELILSSGLYYDPIESLAIAKRDQWGANFPDGATPDENEIATEAVRLDFEHLRAWAQDDWHWCGVSVLKVPADGVVPEDDFKNALWGIESDSDYWKECARELAGQAE